MSTCSTDKIKLMYALYRENITRSDGVGWLTSFNNELTLIETKAKEAAADGRHQDAVDAYSLALCYELKSTVLAERAEAYLRIENFRCAYIDVSEALRLHKTEKADACCGGEHMHDGDYLSRLLYRKSMALEGLGFIDAARLVLQMCKRTATDVIFGLQIEIAEEASQGKVDSPLVDASFLTHYDPLESDPPGFARESFLGDISRFIRNDWTPPSEDEALTRLGSANLMTIREIRLAAQERIFELSKDPVVVVESMMDAYSIGLCVSNDHWLQRAVLSRDDDVVFSYANATEGYTRALRNRCFLDIGLGSLDRASALWKAGHYQRARKELEPALRAKPDYLARKIDALYRDLQQRSVDEPTVALIGFDKHDPLCGSEFTARCMRKIRPSLCSALERICGPEYESDVRTASTDPESSFWTMLFDEFEGLADDAVDEIQMSADTFFGLSALAMLAKRLYAEGNFSSARGLFTVLHRAYNYADPDVLCWRAEAFLQESRLVEAYIDASESIRLKSACGKAYELKAIALSRMGHGHLARKTLKHLRRKCPDFVIRPCLVDRVKSQKDIPLYPIEFLDGYDPEFTDFLGEGPQDALSSSQRRAIDDVVLFEQALRLVEDGKYEQALEHLEKLLESVRLPYSLTLRATCYVETANGQPEVYLKAYADVCKALNMDKHFHDAIHLKGRILSSLGLHSHARRCLKTCLTYVAESSWPAHLLRSIADKDDHPTLPSDLLESIDLSDDGGKNEDADDVTRKAEEIVGNIERYVNKIEHHFGHHILNTTTCKIRNTAKGTLMDRLSSALAKASKQWDEWEEKCRYAEAAARAAKDRLLTREMEMKELQSELKLLGRSHQHLRRELNDTKEKLLKTELPPVTAEDYARLQRTLHEKESALHYMQQAYDSVHAQNHDYKEELQRQKQKRMAAKSRLKESEAVEAKLIELNGELGKTTDIIADLSVKLHRRDAEIAGHKRKEMDQKDAIRRLQRASNEFETKARKLAERVERLEKELVGKSVENSGLLAQLAEAAEALQNKAADDCAPSASADEKANHTGKLPEKRVSLNDHQRLTAFKDAVYATLFSRVEGHGDMQSILDDLRESEDVDGEERAREHGYDSLEAFLRSLTMKDRVIVADSLDGTVYKARPNADTQHILDAQLEGAQYATERRIRNAVNNATNRMRDALKNEREGVTSLTKEMNDLREELRRERREAGELEAQVRCQLCMDRFNRMSFVCADEGREFFCGHVCCEECARPLKTCHICGKHIVSRVQLYL